MDELQNIAMINICRITRDMHDHVWDESVNYVLSNLINMNTLN